MPRKPRSEAQDAIHHVIARGNAGAPIVLDDDDRRTLIAGLARTAGRCGWRVHAYCLMDTHVHVVVETPQPNLGIGMKHFVGGYAFGFNRRHARYGHLFAGPYKASVARTQPYVIQVCAYVVLNPVRACVVDEAVDWAWSSYRASAGLVRVPHFVETRLVPEMLHSEPRRARDLYRELIREQT